MDADKAYHEFKNALSALSLAMENLYQLKQAKSRDWRAVIEAKNLVLTAWKQAQYRYREAREAILEALGW